MDKNNVKELAVIKDNILVKIKSFFKKLFLKKIEDKEEIEKKEKTNDFINSVKIVENSEENRLLKIQKLIADDIISEDELNQEDIKELHKLYDKQIMQLKKEIDEYREKILKLRMNINE